MHTYKETGTAAQPFQVGYYDPSGTFVVLAWFSARNPAAKLVNYLNGGTGQSMN